MREANSVSVPKWPFFLGDAVLIGIAVFIYRESRLPLGHWEIAACGVCAALGAWLSVLPFVLDYRALGKALDATALGAVSEKIQNLEHLATQISGATNHWENVQLQAEKISGSAKEITDRMAAEVRDFTEFMQKVNEGEKSNLRLEVEKLRRAESDWLQAMVHLLDHVYALHNSAVRSGQTRIAEQLAHFQNACRETVRRVGLVPFAVNAGDKFDQQRHHSTEAEVPPAGAVIGENLAPGYTLQGRLVRPALVRVRSEAPAETLPTKAIAAADAQDQLPLETTAQP